MSKLLGFSKQGEQYVVELETGDFVFLRDFVVGEHVLSSECVMVSKDVFRVRCVFVPVDVIYKQNALILFAEWYVLSCEYRKDFDEFLGKELEGKVGRKALEGILGFVLFGEYDRFGYKINFFEPLKQRGLLSDAILFDFLGETKPSYKTNFSNCWSYVDDFVKDLMKDMVRIWLKRFGLKASKLDAFGTGESYRNSDFISILWAVSDVGMEEIYDACRRYIESDKKLFDYLKKLAKKRIVDGRMDFVEALSKIAPEKLAGFISKYMLLK